MELESLSANVESDCDDEMLLGDEGQESLVRRLIATCSAAAVTALIISDTSFSTITSLPGRVGNIHRDG